MPGIDPNRTFIPLRIAVLTVSDTRTLASDTSGAALVERLEAAGHRLADRRMCLDDRSAIAGQVRAWAGTGAIDVVLVTGGTGVTARDVTPEAVRDVIDKEIPGFGELFRAQSLATIGTSTIQSRAMAGVARGTYVFALPGSTGACRDAWDGILVHQLDNRTRPCNFAELLPRLVAGPVAPPLVAAADVAAAIERWCAAVAAGSVDALRAGYTDAARLAEPGAGHEGASACAKAVVAMLGGRTFRYESLGGVQIEPGGQTATDMGALLERGEARFVTSWVWRADGPAVRLHLQQIAPAR